MRIFVTMSLENALAEARRTGRQVGKKGDIFYVASPVTKRDTRFWNSLTPVH